MKTMDDIARKSLELFRKDVQDDLPPIVWTDFDIG
jgi:hypothetical protein